MRQSCGFRSHSQFALPWTKSALESYCSIRMSRGSCLFRVYEITASRNSKDIGYTNVFSPQANRGAAFLCVPATDLFPTLLFLHRAR